MMHCEGLLRQEVSRLGSDTAAKVDSLRECRLKIIFKVRLSAGFRMWPEAPFQKCADEQADPRTVQIALLDSFVVRLFFDAAGILFESSIQWVSKWVTTTWPTV